MQKQVVLFINVFIRVSNSDLIEVLANHYDFNDLDVPYILHAKHLQTVQKFKFDFLNINFLGLPFSVLYFLVHINFHSFIDYSFHTNYYYSWNRSYGDRILSYARINFKLDQSMLDTFSDFIRIFNINFILNECRLFDFELGFTDCHFKVNVAINIEFL